KEMSYGTLVLEGKVRSDGDVFGWYTLPVKSDVCDPDHWAVSAVVKAKADGVDLLGYDHLVFMFPTVSSCGWLGLGQQPGQYTWISGASLPAINHEIGHNFGLTHASSYA